MASIHLATHAAGTQTSTGVLVPLYETPGPAWDTLIQAKTAHPNVPVVAIVNPDGGPGSEAVPTFATGIQRLESAGIIVLAYVWTNYGERSQNSTQADILNYKNWYSVDGIYFDQMASQPGKESYYAALNSYVDSLGMWITVGNAGEDVSQSYVGTVNTIVIYENWGLPNLSVLEGWHTGYAKSSFAVLAYGVSDLNPYYIEDASQYIGYIYITDAGAYNTYFALSSYLAEELQSIDSPPSGPTVAVDSQDINGSSVAGFWTVAANSSGAIIAAGPTPMVFGASVGASYTISASSFGSYVFQHWDDGSTDPVRTVTPGQSITLTAFYAQGSHEKVSTPVTSTTSSAETRDTTQSRVSTQATTTYSASTKTTTTTHSSLTSSNATTIMATYSILTPSSTQTTSTSSTQDTIIPPVADPSNPAATSTRSPDPIESYTMVAALVAAAIGVFVVLQFTGVFKRNTSSSGGHPR